MQPVREVCFLVLELELELLELSAFLFLIYSILSFIFLFFYYPCSCVLPQYSALHPCAYTAQQQLWSYIWFQVRSGFILTSGIGIDLEIIECDRSVCVELCGYGQNGKLPIIIHLTWQKKYLDSLEEVEFGLLLIIKTSGLICWNAGLLRIAALIQTISLLKWNQWVKAFQSDALKNTGGLLPLAEPLGGVQGPVQTWHERPIVYVCVVFFLVNKVHTVQHYNSFTHG